MKTLGLLPVLPLLLGCGTASGSGAEIATAPRTQAGEYKVETIATGLEVPWALAFLPNGDILLTERPGRVRIIRQGKLDPTPLLEISENVIHRGEGGLMDLTLHPDFAKNNWVYLSYVATGPQVQIMRYSYQNGKLGDPQKILDGIGARVNHAGCRTRFGPDGKLYITTGEAFERNRAQDLMDLGGKTLRVNDDGSVPSDNPFVGRKDARPEIWSYGHRNSQGIDWDSAGVQWQSEHGPSGEKGRDGDEVNIVEKGKNYGWPIISHDETQAGLVSPIVQYTPAIAPGDAQFCSGKMFPNWKGNLFVPGLRGECLVRLVIEGRKIAFQERLFEGKYGRLRTILEAPDGSLYVMTSNQDGRGSVNEGDDKILRIYR